MIFSRSYRHDDGSPWVHCFLNQLPRKFGRRFRKAVVILPGGYYSKLSLMETEVALRFQAYGYQAFVLHYSVGKGIYPSVIRETAETVAKIRENCDKWDVDYDGILLCGFSAGGHLAASLAAYWNNPLLLGELYGEICRPNGLILCYPIITAKHPYRANRFVEKLCQECNNEYIPYLSIEDHVNEKMPPCFIWHNTDDQEVSVMNSILLMHEYVKLGLPFEVHFFSKGGHGMGLGDATTESEEYQMDEVSAEWFELALNWVKEI